jgi:hypothetical protein
VNRRKAVAVLSLSSLAAAQAKQSAIRNKFIGVWKLVSCESRDKTSGEVQYPYGVSPVGRITYEAAGRMSVQLMNPGRRRVGGPPSGGAVSAVRGILCEEMREMLSGYVAYFGMFEIDEPSRKVTHYVQACLIPSWVGTALPRSYEFVSDDLLVLTAFFDQAVNKLVWQRDSG